MKRLFLAALLAVLLPMPVQGAECGHHKNVLPFLEKKYGEHVVGMGLIKDRGFMELFVAKSGTWTVVLTTPEGISCIIAAGDSYDTVPPPPRVHPDA